MRFGESSTCKSIIIALHMSFSFSNIKSTTVVLDAAYYIIFRHNVQSL